MKKFFKLLIALVVICAVAGLVYFLLNRNESNDLVYAKVNALDSQLVEAGENKVDVVNNSVSEMVRVINSNGYNMDIQRNYFSAYLQIREAFSVVKDNILQHGEITNKTNNNSNIKAMNKAYDKLVEIYDSSYDYLKSNCLAGSVPDYNKDYVKNFYNVFKGAAVQINIFYYHAGIAFAHGTRNTISTNSLYKLRVEAYTVAADHYATKLIRDQTQTQTTDYIKNRVSTFKSKITTNNQTQYLNNKALYDGILASSKNINIRTVIEKYCDGADFNAYLDTLSKSMREKVEIYKNNILEG